MNPALLFRQLLWLRPCGCAAGLPTAPPHRLDQAQVGAVKSAMAVLCACIYLGWASSTSAQAIDTNRPGFSFTTGVVAPGTWQLETGFSQTRRDSDTRTLSIPQGEIRVGVARQVEVFVNGINWLDDASNTGMADPAIGAKINIGSAASVWDFAVLFDVSIPIGDSNFSNNRWNPAAGLVWAFNGDLNLAGTTRLSHNGDSYQFDNGLKLPFELGAEQVAFIEWEANLPEHGGSSQWLNGGYQVLLKQHMQLDASFGFGLNDRTDEFRIGVGLSYRF